MSLLNKIKEKVSEAVDEYIDEKITNAMMQKNISLSLNRDTVVLKPTSIYNRETQQTTYQLMIAPQTFFQSNYTYAYSLRGQYDTNETGYGIYWNYDYLLNFQQNGELVLLYNKSTNLSNVEWEVKWRTGLVNGVNGLNTIHRYEFTNLGNIIAYNTDNDPVWAAFNTNPSLPQGVTLGDNPQFIFTSENGLVFYPNPGDHPNVKLDIIVNCKTDAGMDVMAVPPYESWHIINKQFGYTRKTTTDDMNNLNKITANDIDIPLNTFITKNQGWVHTNRLFIFKDNKFGVYKINYGVLDKGKPNLITIREYTQRSNAIQNCTDLQFTSDGFIKMGITQTTENVKRFTSSNIIMNFGLQNTSGNYNTGNYKIYYINDPISSTGIYFSIYDRNKRNTSYLVDMDVGQS